MDHKYNIECTEEELRIISRCVEVCHRISCGQMDTINEIIPNNIPWEDLNKLKETAFPELSRGENYSWRGGYGTLHEPKNKAYAKSFLHFQAITYPIYREILHFLAIKNSIGNVYQSETLNAGHGGFIKIREIKK